MRLLLSYFATPPLPFNPCDLRLHRTLLCWFLSLFLEAILKMDVVVTKVEDNVLNAHIAIGLDTPMIDAISYMADFLVLLIWLSLLIIQYVRILSQGAHPHLRGSFLRPVNMRSTFVSLKHPNLPPLLMLPRPVMSLFALHIHLHLGSLILEPLIISLVIKTFFLLLPFRLLYLQLP